MKILKDLIQRRGKRAQAAASKDWLAAEEDGAENYRQPSIADLLVHLPMLATRKSGVVDFDQSDSLVLARLALNADASCKTVLRGMSAMGNLMSHAGPEVEDGTISPDDFEALGNFMAQMTEFSGMLVALQTNCRRVEHTTR